MNSIEVKIKKVLSAIIIVLSVIVVIIFCIGYFKPIQHDDVKKEALGVDDIGFESAYHSELGVTVSIGMSKYMVEKLLGEPCISDKKGYTYDNSINILYEDERVFTMFSESDIWIYRGQCKTGSSKSDVIDIFGDEYIDSFLIINEIGSSFDTISYFTNSIKVIDRSEAFFCFTVAFDENEFARVFIISKIAQDAIVID